MPRVNAAVKSMDGGVVRLVDAATTRSGRLIVTAICGTVIGLGLLREQKTDWRLVLVLAGNVIEVLVRFATWPRECLRLHTSVILASLLGILAVNLLRFSGSPTSYWFWNVVVAVLLPICIWRLIHPLAPRKPQA